VPEKFAALAGRGFEPVRHTAMHHRHLEAGAQMMPAGLWMRPAYYGAKGDAQRAIEREVRAVREGVGMIDVSTLGGLEVRGPDAAAFVDRMYTWAYEKQQIGRARYALMTDQTGVVIDDGVAARLHERHYYVTATTSAVDQVYRQMTWFNVQWKMDVDVANVTAAYSGINLAGPKSREVIQKLASDIDFSAEAFPYMAARVGKLAGIPVRILRVGFVGELGYEIHVPSSMGEALWDRLMEAGKPFGIVPFGVEAQRILRLEKGHLIVSQDTDGLTGAYAAGLAWAVKLDKGDFAGKPELVWQSERDDYHRLVGLQPHDGTVVPPEASQIVEGEKKIVGRITSSRMSPTLGRSICMGFVAPHLAEPGTTVTVHLPDGERIPARVMEHHAHFDPEGVRQRG
jgi:sarcosine oxidase subunit alpha